MRFNCRGVSFLLVGEATLVASRVPCGGSSVSSRYQYVSLERERRCVAMNLAVLDQVDLYARLICGELYVD